MSTAPLRAISPVPSSVLSALTQDTIPRLETLHELERHVRKYRDAHQSRITHCKELEDAVDESFSSLNDKDKDRNRPRSLKKEPAAVDLAIGSQPQRPKVPTTTTLRIPQSQTVPVPMSTSTSTSPVPPSVLPATPTTKPTPIVRAGSATLPSSSSTKPSKTKKRRRPEDDDFVNDPLATTRGPSSNVKHGHKDHKSKKARLDDDMRMNPAGFRKITDWSEPAKGGLPSRPPRNPLPVPQTDDPSQVNDNFSERKQPPNQATAHSYWNYIEPWIRQAKDEDVAFLAFGADDEEYWEMPPLGRHYSEVWEELDRASLGLAPLPPHKATTIRNPYAAWTDPLPSTSANPPITLTNLSLQPHSSIPPPNKGVRWDPATLTEQDLMTEEHGSGPLTERVFSSFLYMPGSVKDDDDALAGASFNPSGFGTKGGPGLGRGIGQGTVGDLEERLMKECKALGLIMEDEEPDYSQPQDDQISSELRRCQRALKAQIAINEARKRRLLSIAEMRLSYAEYEDAKEGIEKNLAAMFARLGNSGVPKVTKKKKKEKEKIAGQAAVSTTGEPAGINGLGLVGMDGNLLVTQEIVETVNVLKKWKELGKAFDKLEEDRPGLIKGLPRSSIYEGLDKEIGEIEEGHKKIQAAHQEEEEEGEGEEEEAEGSDDDVLMRDGD